MKKSHITDFIVDTEDYFAAHTDNNEIRFGLLGSKLYQISKYHEVAQAVLNCKTSDDVKDIFDDFQNGIYGECVYDINT